MTGRLILVGVAVAAAVAAALVLLVRPADDELVGEPVEEFMHIHGLGIAPWAPDDVHLSTHQGLILIDADDEWWFVSEEPHDFMGFAVHPTEEGVLYTSGHPAPGSGLENPVGFMVSEDGGRTWTPRSLHGQTDFHAMAVQPTDGDVVYGWNVAGGGLFRSTDAGQSWEVLEVPVLDEVGGALSLAVHPDDADEVLAATQEALLRLRDDAREWEALIEAPVSAITHVGVDPDHLLAYQPTPGPGLVESVDGGRSWQELGFVVEGDAVGHIAVHPDEPEVIYVGTFGESLYRTLDGGATWEQLARDATPQ